MCSGVAAGAENFSSEETYFSNDKPLTEDALHRCFRFTWADADDSVIRQGPGTL